jgi:hypothetical protein
MSRGIAGLEDLVSRARDFFTFDKACAAEISLAPPAFAILAKLRIR